MAAFIKSRKATYAFDLLFFKKISKNQFFIYAQPKIGILGFSRKVISLYDYMLLHKSNINVAIAIILVHIRKNLSDAQEPK